MAKRRKYTKKWLKEPDEFITLFDQVANFISRYEKVLLQGLVGVILVGLIIGGFSYFQKAKEKELEGLLVEAYSLYSQADASDAGDFTGALQAYQAIIEKFPHKGKSIRAYLYLGHVYSRTGDNPKAAQMYQKVMELSKKGTITREIALLRVGYAHEAMSQYSQAIDHYKKIAEQEKGAFKGQALLALGRCYEQLKDYKSALTYYSSYLSDLSDPSAQASEAIQEKVKHLETLL